MAPRLTRALAALRDGFDQLSPGRDRATDGWVGNEEHQAHTSGHNPDDTAGSRAEYTDTDDVPEVRAIDVDADLRHPTVDMSAAVARILATPADRRRLRYVIWQRRIASASSGWVWRPYDGDNPHTAHAHFSGNPDTDDDGQPWSVATMGATMEHTAAQLTAYPWQYAGSGMPGVPARHSTLWVLGSTYTNLAALAAKVDAIAATLAGHANGDWLRERFAEIDQRFTTLGDQVDDVPADVVDQLGDVGPADLVDALAAAGFDLDALAAAIAARTGDQVDQAPGSVTVDGGAVGHVDDGDQAAMLEQR